MIHLVSIAWTPGTPTPRAGLDFTPNGYPDQLLHTVKNYRTWSNSLGELGVSGQHTTHGEHQNSTNRLVPPGVPRSNLVTSPGDVGSEEANRQSDVAKRNSPRYEKGSRQDRWDQIPPRRGVKLFRATGWLSGVHPVICCESLVSRGTTTKWNIHERRGHFTLTRYSEAETGEMLCKIAPAVRR